LEHSGQHANAHRSHPFHIFHSYIVPGSPLHPVDSTYGIKPLDFAVPAPDGSEPVMWKCVNSSFIGTDQEAYLRKHEIRQVFFAGLTTDHCVSTTRRMAANLGVVGEPVTVNSDGSHPEIVDIERGRIVLVADATATFAKGAIDAETIHNVSVASLENEFADVLSTDEIVKALEGVN
jgi:nicotinamidase-related amidase